MLAERRVALDDYERALKGGRRAWEEFKARPDRKCRPSTVEKLVSVAREDFHLVDFPDANEFLFSMSVFEGAESTPWPHKALWEQLRDDLQSRNRSFEYICPKGYLIKEMLGALQKELEGRVRVVPVNVAPVGSNLCHFWEEVHHGVAQGDGRGWKYDKEEDTNLALRQVKELLRRRSGETPISLVLRNVDVPVRDVLEKPGSPEANRETVRSLKANICDLVNYGRVTVAVFGTFGLRGFCNHVCRGGSGQNAIASPFYVTRRFPPLCDNWPEWSARRIHQFVPEPSDPEGLVDLLVLCEEHPKALLDGLSSFGRGAAVAAKDVESEHQRVAEHLFDLWPKELRTFLAERGWVTPDASGLDLIDVLVESNILVEETAGTPSPAPGPRRYRPRVRAWENVWAKRGRWT